MLNEKMKSVLRRAVQLVLSRDGDIATECGIFATVDTDEIIMLEADIVEAFELDSDDVMHSDAPHIAAMINSL